MAIQLSAKSFLHVQSYLFTVNEQFIRLKNSRGYLWQAESRCFSNIQLYVALRRKFSLDYSYLATVHAYDTYKKLLFTVHDKYASFEQINNTSVYIMLAYNLCKLSIKKYSFNLLL